MRMLFSWAWIFALALTACSTLPEQKRSLASNNDTGFLCEHEEDIYVFLAKFGEIYHYTDGRERGNADSYSLTMIPNDKLVTYSFVSIEGKTDFILTFSKDQEFLSFSKYGKNVPEYQCKIVSHQEASDRLHELNTPISLPR